MSQTQPMTKLEQVTWVLTEARVAGGWDDEVVARQVLAVLSLCDAGGSVLGGNGKPAHERDGSPAAPEPGGK